MHQEQKLSHKTNSSLQVRILPQVSFHPPVKGPWAHGHNPYPEHINISLTFPSCTLQCCSMKSTNSTEKCPQDGPPEHSNRVSTSYLSYDAKATVLQYTNHLRPHQVQVLFSKVNDLQIRGKQRNKFQIIFCTQISFRGNLMLNISIQTILRSCNIS